ncbi:hypothetical protein RN629_16620 [Sphingomonadaceae bacterium jetA1]|uniref:hypothetical protein n=1 Tax=Facivitalis istanbulensis TaxID=3075838 RepID=UPI00348F0E85
MTGQVSATRQSGLSDTDSSQQSLGGTLSANRKLLTLPAGPVIVNLFTQASRSRTTTMIGGAEQAFSGHNVNLGATLSVPLWRTPSPGQGSVVSHALGSLSATLGGNVRQTDAGQGKGVNAGLSWLPLGKFRLTGNWSRSTDSVSDAQRFAPEYYGAPITVFDFVTGQSAEVLPILGGTPDLRPPRFDRVALSALAGPFLPWNVAGSVSLQRSNAANSAGPLPAVTPELEAAFPDRFRRDATGRLTAIDQRPINFASTRTESLASNLGASFPLGEAAPGKPRGTLRLTLNHNLQLRNVTTIHASLPPMNRLVGDGGGVPRQQLDVQVDGRRGAWGLNMAARWRSGYRTRRDTGRDSAGDLRVSPVGTIDLRFSYVLQRAIRPSQSGVTPRRGAGIQFGLDVINVFDARPGASLGDGRPAPGYGRDDQDPVGRAVRLFARSRF